MATFYPHTPATQQELQAFVKKDLPCYVKYIHKFTLDDDHLFGCKFVFRYGMPALGPTGTWGYTFNGQTGITSRHVPQPNKHRAVPRHEEITEYVIEFQSLHRVLAPITEYYGIDRINLREPKRIIEMHLASLAKTIPLYNKYLLYKIFAGPNAQKDDSRYIKKWMQRYIEPSDGATNGYPFYFHNAYKEINLQDIITPKEVKTHPLKTRLESINKALRSDSRKIEVDPTKDRFLTSKNYVRGNLTEEGKGVYALFRKARVMCDKILRDGMFEDKYNHMNTSGAAKWKNTKGEAVTDSVPIPINDKSELIVLFNDQDMSTLDEETELTAPAKEFINRSNIKGTIHTTDLLDRGECLILHRDLIQIWVLPTTARYSDFDYKQPYEETRDYFHAFDHSLDIVPIYASIYLKLKGEFPPKAA